MCFLLLRNARAWLDQKLNSSRWFIFLTTYLALTPPPDKMKPHLDMVKWGDCEGGGVGWWDKEGTRWGFCHKRGPKYQHIQFFIHVSNAIWMVSSKSMKIYHPGLKTGMGNVKQILISGKRLAFRIFFNEPIESPLRPLGVLNANNIFSID